MKDTIYIRGLRLFAYHGVNEDEKRLGQDFLIDISAKTDFSAACRSDSLADTVSYAAMIKTVRRVFTAQKHELLERAAQLLADAIFEEFPALRRLKIRISKPDAPIAADFEAVGVEITRTAAKTAAPKLAVVGLGANLGEATSTILLARDALKLLPKTQLKAFSRLYKTAPQGCQSPQPDYINACALVQTGLSPRALLGALFGIEAAFGRQRPYPNAARTLDLDLLLYEGAALSSEELTLPHPRMGERAFVLVPLGDLFPNGNALGYKFNPKLPPDGVTLLDEHTLNPA
ncbi:MAG: 2-amino-4-hydroxy-6-hydroxymethyldihydropteridine diphosphokinase [Clostridium sp.]|jgi:dihydroneopterin aldolase/2-amino-4-hydroxy-6-hydroxymethyldihydropteridine diphosphokinase|nr:2-amino-4-hydroxy-6-hydroxymethyldihydropteridine diphosphokinase [Clostridium sp.]